MGNPGLTDVLRLDDPTFVHRMWIGGQQVPEGRQEVLPSPGAADHSRSAAFGNAALVDKAVEAAQAAESQCAALSRHARAAILERLASAIESEEELLTLSLTLEVGKSLPHSRSEVQRVVSTLRAASHDATQLVGTEIPVDGVGVGERVIAYTMFEPVGVIAGICGFNFPLLLAAHKIAGAVGAGAPIVLKPSERTPFTTLIYGPLLSRAGWPTGGISVVNGGADVGERLVEHPGTAMVSFTGSASVGARIAARAGALLKRTALELGSNSATVVAQDADLAAAAEACAAGIVASSGQSCISVQRIVAHVDIADHLTRLISERLDALMVGFGSDPEVQVGHLISQAEETRVKEVFDEALSLGARQTTLRVADGRTPALLDQVSAEARIANDEAFGPIAAVLRYHTDEEAIAIVNSVDFGLMTGIFTDSLDRALSIARGVKSGGVHINNASTFRPDNMPYGGVKSSGIGREGPAYAMREYSVEKVLTIKL